MKNTLIPLTVSLIVSALFWGVDYQQTGIFGAPKIFIATQSTSTPATDFGFAIGTTSTNTLFGTTTLMTYGSTTLQQWDAGIAFRILDPATTTVFSVDTSGNLVFTGTCTGCPAGSGAAFAWTPYADGVSTSTLLRFDAGFISQASSTVDGVLNLNGALSASSTAVFGDNVQINNLTSALVITGAGGLLAEYTGTTCTNQFTRALSVLGVATCETVVLTADVTGDLPFANLAQVSANSVLGNITGATADAASIATSSLFTFTGTGNVALSDSPTFTTDITFPALSIEAGAYGAATIDGDDINSNLAGRSLTLTAASPDTFDLDSEIFTKKISFVVASSTMSTTTSVAQHSFATAITITEISCSTDTGSSTVQFDYRALATPNTAGTNVMQSPLECGASGTNSTSTLANPAIVADVPFNFQISDAQVTTLPTIIRVHVKFTIND